MNKPYEKDIALLREELTHYEYVFRKFSLEKDHEKVKEFELYCSNIQEAIRITQMRQQEVLTEWAALSAARRKKLMLPLWEALEKTVSGLKQDCPECSIYLEQVLGDFLWIFMSFPAKNYKRIGWLSFQGFPKLIQRVHRKFRIMFPEKEAFLASCGISVEPFVQLAIRISNCL